MSLFLLENFNHMLGKREQSDIVSRVSQPSNGSKTGGISLETVYVSKLPVVVQIKPTVNVGIEKKKQFNTQKEGELFIVGPWVKKQGGTDLESQRLANCENMNAHLNWHADEVLEFILTLYNPLKVPLPLTKIEVFKQSSSSSSNHHPFLALNGDKIQPLEPQRKTQLSLKFRSIQ